MKQRGASSRFDAPAEEFSLGLRVVHFMLQAEELILGFNDHGLDRGWIVAILNRPLDPT